MKCEIETCNDGSFVMSNIVNKVRIIPKNTHYIVQGCGNIKNVESREKAFDAAFSLLATNSVIDVDGFINHLEMQMDIGDSYRQTIYNIIDYGIHHECLVQNQFVDWLTSLLANVKVEDVVRFMNDYWLNADYLLIKENQMFIITEWVLSNDIWPDTIGHVDMGPKNDLARGYRIEVQDLCGTKWLPIDFVHSDNIMAHFNDDAHCELYTINNFMPTGKISFMGYFKKVGDEYEPID